MADPIKLSDSQGSLSQSPTGSSPLSPQIKVPPPPARADLPSNLPTGEVRPSTLSPQMPKPPLPPAASTFKSPTADIETGRVSPTFKSSIRTMQEDIGALKKGQAPAGFKVEKQSEKEINPVQQTFTPKMVMPPPPFSNVGLGKLEKSKPLERVVMPPTPPSSLKVQQTPTFSPTTPSGQSIKPPISIPSTGSSPFMSQFASLGSKKLLLTIAGLIIVVLVAIFFVIRGEPTPVTVSPTPSSSPTRTPITFEDSFDISSSVTFASGVNSFQRLVDVVNKGELIIGKPSLYKILESQTNQRHSFSNFMSTSGASVPQEVLSLVEDRDFYLTLMLRVGADYSNGFIVKLKNTSGIEEALGHWESNLPSNLKDFFKLDPSKAASVVFLDNAYQGKPIKYMNFPGPLKTIDFAILTSQNGDRYLAFTDSRDHMYAIIDELR